MQLLLFLYVIKIANQHNYLSISKKKTYIYIYYNIIKKQIIPEEHRKLDKTSGKMQLLTNH